MNRAGEQTWLEWAESHYTALGRTKGALQALRKTLHGLLEQRFGKLPRTLIHRIEASGDTARLQACIYKVLKIKSPNELEL